MASHTGVSPEDAPAGLTFSDRLMVMLFVVFDRLLVKCFYLSLTLRECSELEAEYLNH